MFYALLSHSVIIKLIRIQVEGLEREELERERLEMRGLYGLFFV
jgi:hypothetical protein